MDSHFFKSCTRVLDSCHSGDFHPKKQRILPVKPAKELCDSLQPSDLSVYDSTGKKHRRCLPVVQTSTQTGLGFKAGVKDYRVDVTDLLAAFRVIAQPGVPPEEAGAAIAAESSTGTWTTVWTDGLTSLDRYKGRCYDLELVSGEESHHSASIAYPLDLFEEGSVTNILTSIVGNVFGFKALK